MVEIFGLNGGIIIFAPHPDDEVLGCGGTIARKIKEGDDVVVIFMTDGSNSHLHEFGIASKPSPQELRIIRKEEAIKANGILGVKAKNLVFFGIEDRTLNSNKNSARKKVMRIMKKISPIEVYFPSEKDLHIDHKTTNEIINNLLNTHFPDIKKFQYTIWSNEEWNELERVKKHDTICIVDISEFLDLKKKAIEEYVSQITIFSNKQKRPILDANFVDRFRKKTEAFERG